MTKRTSTRAHWEEFWIQKKNVAQVYDNAERIVARLKNSAGNLAGKKVLEVGAGTGRDSFLLAEAGAEVTVLDYADNSLTIMRGIASGSQIPVLLVKGDAFNLPIPDNTFDIVFHQGLLEHFENPQPIIDENFRVLKPNGLLLADVPQKYHIYTVIKHILIVLNKWFAGWETEFTIGQLARLLEKAGFQIALRYGEWMRPSLFYRIVREAALKIHLTLPLYPKGIPVLRDWRSQLRQKMLRTQFALVTGLDIGVVGKKPVENTKEN